MKYCKKCNQEKEDSNFTAKAKYCRDCVRANNRASAEKKGIKEKFIPIITEDGKQCATCKEIKPLEDFSPAKRGRFGRSSYCKPCASKTRIETVSKEDRRIQVQKYRDDNREWWRSLHRINQFNRRSKIKAVSDGTVTPDFAKSIYAMTTCYYCKEETPEKFRTIEHMNPLNKGGLHSASNITMSCFACNSSKRDMTENEYLEYRKNNDKSNISEDNCG